MPDSRPIGILDSGIGGLTVARAINALLPQESLLFFGDTAHLPYGEKSPAAIRHYAGRVTQYLLERGCKAIVIACNSASAAAHQFLHRRYDGVLPVIDVIDPVAEYIAGQPHLRNVGLIGTKRTVQSKAYHRRLKALRPDIELHALATPLLVPMIEEGYFNNNISQAIINNYLSHRVLQGIDSLILGCTHFPLIRPEVERFYNNTVEILDTAGIVARRVKEVLSGAGLLNDSPLPPSHHFFVSDYTASFEKTTQIFFGHKVPLEAAEIWE